MSPVQTITLRGVGYEHTKPLYLCETCMAPASFGFTVLENNHRRRKWFCRDHQSVGEGLLSGDMGGERVA